MNYKEDQDIFNFFTDNLAKASQEFQNRVKESEFYKRIKEELDKYVRIPIIEFPSKDWFREHGWTVGVDDVSGIKKERFTMNGPFTIIREGYKNIGPFYIISERIGDEVQVVYKGSIPTAEDFLRITELISV